jgi:hypothetical protein
MIEANDEFSLMFGRSKLRFLPEDRWYWLRCHVLCLVIGRTIIQHSTEVGFGSSLKKITRASFCEPGWRSQYYDQATGWTVRHSNFGKGKTPFSNTSRQFLGPIQPPIQWAPGFFPGVKMLEGEVTTQLRLVRIAKNEWSYTSTSLHAFMA